MGGGAGVGGAVGGGARCRERAERGFEQGAGFGAQLPAQPAGPVRVVQDRELLGGLPPGLVAFEGVAAVGVEGEHQVPGELGQGAGVELAGPFDQPALRVAAGGGVDPGG